MGTVVYTASAFHNPSENSQTNLKFIKMNKTLMVCLAVVLFAAVAFAAPFNAVHTPHFYNGDIARAPYFSMQEAVPGWGGLVTKSFTLCITEGKNDIKTTLKIKRSSYK